MKVLKLFIGSLPASMNKSQVREYFSQFGRVTKVELQANEGICVGTGFVEVVSASTLKSVLARSHLLNGRKIVVEEYAQGEKLAAKRRAVAKRRVRIANIDKSITQQQLIDELGVFGDVETAYRIFGTNGQPKLFGFALFFDESSARRCIEARFIVINEHEIYFEKYNLGKLRNPKNSLPSKQPQKYLTKSETKNLYPPNSATPNLPEEDYNYNHNINGLQSMNYPNGTSQVPKIARGFEAPGVFAGRGPRFSRPSQLQDSRQIIQTFVNRQSRVIADRNRNLLLPYKQALVLNSTVIGLNHGPDNLRLRPAQSRTGPLAQ